MIIDSKKITDLINESLISILKKEIQPDKQILEEINKLTKEHIETSDNKKNDLLISSLNYFRNIHDTIKSRRYQRPQFNIDPFPDFYASLHEIIQSFEDKIIVEQAEKRFLITEKDGRSMRFLKYLKIKTYNTFIIPKKILNLIRRLFKKSPLCIPYWKHSVHLKNLAFYIFEYKLTEAFISLYSDLSGNTARLINDYKDCINTFEIEYTHQKNQLSLNPKPENHIHPLEKTIQLFDDLINELHNQVSNTTATLNAQFKDLFEKAGTMEFSNRRIRYNRINKKIISRKKLLSKTILEWENSFFAIYDDFRNDTEINCYVYNNLLEAKRIEDNFLNDINTSLESKLTEVKEYISSIRTSITSSDDNEIRKTLLRSKLDIQRELEKRIIPSLSERVSKHNISGFINKIETLVKDNLDSFNKERIIIKKEDTLNPVKSTELSIYSPGELISFEILSLFSQKTNHLKTVVFEDLEKILSRIADLDNIILFAINSALSGIESKEKNTSYSKIAIDGIIRVENILDEIKNDIISFNSDKYSDFFDLLIQYCASIEDLKINENLLNIRLRIVKGKAIEKTKKYRLKIYNKIQTYFKKIYLGFSNIRDYLNKHYNTFSKKFVLTSKAVPITREASDFLAEAKQIEEKLPHVYKKLYQIEPIADLDLFEGRKHELEKLDIAFSAWNKGRYASTVIVGEKWGGLTSFITYSLFTIKFNYNHVRLSAKNLSRDPQLLLNSITEKLNLKSSSSFDELSERLNNLPAKCIIILEDIQTLFLRKIDGFHLLKDLLRLINDTHHNIFWIVTSTLYTWKYLNNAMNLNDHFSYIIQMEQFSDQEIINILDKRNRISGYKIEFEPSGEVLADRKYTRMNDKEKQTYLKNRFISELNSFASSNVSLALVYWILSTKSISDGKITVGSFHHPDLSFISILNAAKVHTLHALILHDGLDQEELSAINNITIDEASTLLMILHEDGIVYFTENKYMVNPIIYRNIVQMLKNKNLLY